MEAKERMKFVFTRIGIMVAVGLAVMAGGIF